MPPFAPSQQPAPSIPVPAPRPPIGYTGTPPQAMPAQPAQTFPVPAQAPPTAAVPPPAASGNQQAIAAALSMVSEDQRVRSSFLLIHTTKSSLMSLRGILANAHPSVPAYAGADQCVAC
jgi:hypothetical protein